MDLLKYRYRAAYKQYYLLIIQVTMTTTIDESVVVCIGFFYQF